MAITADESTMIVAESDSEQLAAYDIDDDGTLSHRRVLASTPGSIRMGSASMRPARSGTLCGQAALCVGARRWRGARDGHPRPGVCLRAQLGRDPKLFVGADPMPSAARPAKSWPFQHPHPAEATRR